MPLAKLVNGIERDIVGKFVTTINTVNTVSRIAVAPETAYSAGCPSPSTIFKPFTRRRS